MKKSPKKPTCKKSLQVQRKLNLKYKVFPLDKIEITKLEYDLLYAEIMTLKNRMSELERIRGYEMPRQSIPYPFNPLEEVKC